MTGDAGGRVAEQGLRQRPGELLLGPVAVRPNHIRNGFVQRGAFLQQPDNPAPVVHLANPLAVGARHLAARCLVRCRTEFRDTDTQAGGQDATVRGTELAGAADAAGSPRGELVGAAPQRVQLAGLLAQLAVLLAVPIAFAGEPREHEPIQAPDDPAHQATTRGFGLFHAVPPDRSG